MRCFRKTLTYFFLTMLLIQSAGMLFVFLYSRYTHKSDVRNFLAKNISIENFELIKVPTRQTFAETGNFKRIEADEFILNSKLYDIFKEEIKGDTVYFYSLHDDQEEGLFSKLGDYITSHRLNARIPASFDLSQFINVLATYNHPEKFNNTNFKHRNGCYSIAQTSSYLSIILDTDSPPPRMNFV